MTETKDDLRHNTWNVTNIIKSGMRDMKQILEKRLRIRTRLTQNQFMILVVNDHKKILDIITQSNLDIKNKYNNVQEYGIVYRCLKCNEPAFVRKFNTDKFRCISCGHIYEHEDETIDFDIDDVPVNGVPMTRMDIMEEIGRQLQKRFPKY